MPPGPILWLHDSGFPDFRAKDVTAVCTVLQCQHRSRRYWKHNEWHHRDSKRTNHTSLPQACAHKWTISGLNRGPSVLHVAVRLRNRRSTTDLIARDLLLLCFLGDVGTQGLGSYMKVQIRSPGLHLGNFQSLDGYFQTGSTLRDVSGSRPYHLPLLMERIHRWRGWLQKAESKKFQMKPTCRYSHYCASRDAELSTKAIRTKYRLLL